MDSLCHTKTAIRLLYMRAIGFFKALNFQVLLTTIRLRVCVSIVWWVLVPTFVTDRDPDTDINRDPKRPVPINWSWLVCELVETEPRPTVTNQDQKKCKDNSSPLNNILSWFYFPHFSGQIYIDVILDLMRLMSKYSQTSV